MCSQPLDNKIYLNFELNFFSIWSIYKIINKILFFPQFVWNLIYLGFELVYDSQNLGLITLVINTMSVIFGFGTLGLVWKHNEYVLVKTRHN